MHERSSQTLCDFKGRTEFVTRTGLQTRAGKHAVEEPLEESRVRPPPEELTAAFPDLLPAANVLRKAARLPNQAADRIDPKPN